MANSIGFGSSISTSTGVIAKVRSINTAGTEANWSDTTTLDSTEGNFRTGEPGLIAPGTIELEMLYDKVAATHALMADKLVNKTSTEWSLAYAGSTTDPDTFTGFVTGRGTSIPLDDQIIATWTITATGDLGLTT